MTFPGEAKFLIAITGTLDIVSCIWSLVGDSSFNDKQHFSVDGGNLKFNNVVVGSFNRPNFQFIVYSSQGGSVTSDKLNIQGIITTGDMLIRLNSNSETNFTNSVCFYLFIYLCY
jgi:hypothetical protein